MLRIAVGALGLILVLDALLLLRRPVLGVADNGDFWRVMRPAGIRYSEPGPPKMHEFVEPRFKTVRSHLSRHSSSGALVAWAARAFGSFTGEPGVLDLRQSGVAYLLLLVLAAALLWRSTPAPLGVSVLLFWVLGDPGYLLFFNSFYADGAALVGWLGIVVWILRQDGGPSSSLQRNSVELGAPSTRVSTATIGVVVRSAALVLFTALLAFSKASYAPVALVATLAVLATLARTGLLRTREGRVTLAATAAVAVLGTAHFVWGDGPRFPRINRYNAVFVGIASASRDPGGTLAALGLPADRLELVGKSSFDDRVTEADRDLTFPVTPTRIALRYLADPSAAFESARRVTQALAFPRTSGRSQRTAEERGSPRFVESRPWQFGRVRRLLLGREWKVFSWIICGFGWLSLSAVRRRWDALATVVAFFLAVICAQAVIAVLGDGLFGLPHHLLIARLSLDSEAIVLLVVFFRWASRRAAFRMAERAREPEHESSRERPLARHSATCTDNR